MYKEVRGSVCDAVRAATAARRHGNLVALRSEAMGVRLAPPDAVLAKQPTAALGHVAGGGSLAL